MSDFPILNNDLGTVLIGNAEFRDELLTFAGAGTIAEGTILARDSASGNLVPYAIGGVTNENGIPKALVTYAVTAAGAGNIAVRVAVVGRFRAERLVVDADGDNSNITNAILDELRLYNLTPIDVQELAIIDNQ